MTEGSDARRSRVAQAILQDARAGVRDAMRLAGHLTALQGDWSSALDWLEAAASAGSHSAQGELVILSPDVEHIGYLAGRVRQNLPFSVDVWRRVRASVDIGALLTPPGKRALSRDPKIVAASAIASENLCRWLLAQAAPHLRRALVTEAGRDEAFADPARSNRLCVLSFDLAGLPVLALRERMARLADVPVDHLEDSTILQYAPGEQFSEHHDAFEPDDADLALGQRRQTLLVYLNENYQGGETDFPVLNWRFRGRAGEGLLWTNADESQAADPRMRHAGLPPTRGEKWILSQWIRDRPVA